MAYCCACHCSSDSKKKLPGVFFLEISADVRLRETWICAIRRDKWTPSSTCNYSRVCSRHFKESDFLEEKRRCLKKGIVPTVFEEYPLSLQPKNEKQRSDASIKKRSLCGDAREDGIARKIQKRIQNEDPLHATIPSSTTTHERVCKSTLPDTTQFSERRSPHNMERLHAPTPCSSTTGEREGKSSLLDRNDFGEHGPTTHINETAMPIDEVTLFNVTLTNVVEQAIQVNIRSSHRLLATERTKWKRKVHDLKQQIERL